MKSLFFSNIRCFSGDFEVKLHPLTILVGENSSGKSTLLALLRLAWHATAGAPVDFNTEPFLLGSYDQIASFHGGRRGRPKTFRLGATFQLDTELKAWSEFRKEGGQPSLSRFAIEYKDVAMEIELPPKGLIPTVQVRAPSGLAEFKRGPILPPNLSLMYYAMFMPYYLGQQRAEFGVEFGEGADRLDEDADRLDAKQARLVRSRP